MSRRITTRMRHAGKPRHGSFLYRLDQADGSLGPPVRVRAVRINMPPGHSDQGPLRDAVATAVLSMHPDGRIMEVGASKPWYSRNDVRYFREPIYITGTFTVTDPEMMAMVFGGSMRGLSIDYQHPNHRRIWRQIRTRQLRRRR